MYVNLKSATRIEETWQELDQRGAVEIDAFGAQISSV
jgi:hypothetical protein